MDNAQVRPPLSPEQKSNWNSFIDFVAMQKMAGNPTLDQRNKNVGMMLINKFNMANPKQQIAPEMISNVQQEMQDYRNAQLQQWKAGKVVINGLKSDAEFMPNISQVDGWPGTKTLSTKFPGASVTIATPAGKQVKNYGTDTQAYDRDMGLAVNPVPVQPVK